MPARPSSPAGLLRPDAPSLGDFLRARRARLRPEDFHFPRGRRRVPGLRREEAAQLCGVSTTWYTWIEQGRTTAVSSGTLHAIADGLRLSRAERTYLFELSGRADPVRNAVTDSDPRVLRALVRAIRTPAYLIDRHWDVIVWNRAAAELFTHWLGRLAVPGRTRRRAAPGESNLLRYVFLDPQAPRFIVDWPDRSARLVAEYRADTASAGDDPVRRRLVRELSAASAAFEQAWRAQQVLAREGGVRMFRHPKRGVCAYQQHTLRPAQHPELKLTVLVPHSP